MPFEQIRAVLLDLDGVMYRGNVLCHGAAQFVTFLRERHIRPFFLSNNSRAGADAVADKLTRLGVPTGADDVVTAAELLVRYMSRVKRKTSAAVVGSDWLANELGSQGWQVRDSRAEYLVVGLDHQFTYAKLKAGVEMLLAGARLLAANRDPVNPIEGTLEAGCGSIVAAFQAASGVRGLCIGKPSLRMLREAQRRLRLEADQLLIVGDSLVSDMALARRGGTHSTLLLSGQTTRATIDRLPAGRRPDLVLEDLAELKELWQESLA